MMYSKPDFISKIHLIISLLIVIPVAFVYGFNPSSSFDLQVNTLDEHSFFKAIMGVYLGFSVVWLLGLFKAKFLKVALVTNMVFMLGLGFGRIMGFFIDGMPNMNLVFGAFGELILGFYGIWVLNRP